MLKATTRFNTNLSYFVEVHLDTARQIFEKVETLNPREMVD